MAEFNPVGAGSQMETFDVYIPEATDTAHKNSIKFYETYIEKYLLKFLRKNDISYTYPPENFPVGGLTLKHIENAIKNSKFVLVPMCNAICTDYYDTIFQPDLCPEKYICIDIEEGSSAILIAFRKFQILDLKKSSGKRIKENEQRLLRTLKGPAPTTLDPAVLEASQTVERRCEAEGSISTLSTARMDVPSVEHCASESDCVSNYADDVREEHVSEIEQAKWTAPIFSETASTVDTFDSFRLENSIQLSQANWSTENVLEDEMPFKDFLMPTQSNSFSTDKYWIKNEVMCLTEPSCMGMAPSEYLKQLRKGQVGNPDARFLLQYVIPRATQSRGFLSLSYLFACMKEEQIQLFALESLHSLLKTYKKITSEKFSKTLLEIEKLLRQPIQECKMFSSILLAEKLLLTYTRIITMIYFLYMGDFVNLESYEVMPVENVNYFVNNNSSKFPSSAQYKLVNLQKLSCKCLQRLLQTTKLSRRWKRQQTDEYRQTLRRVVTLCSGDAKDHKELQKLIEGTSWINGTTRHGWLEKHLILHYIALKVSENPDLYSVVKSTVKNHMSKANMSDLDAASWIMLYEHMLTNSTSTVLQPVTDGLVNLLRYLNKQAGVQPNLRQVLLDNAAKLLFHEDSSLRECAMKHVFGLDTRGHVRPDVMPDMQAQVREYVMSLHQHLGLEVDKYQTQLSRHTGESCSTRWKGKFAKTAVFVSLKAWLPQDLDSLGTRLDVAKEQLSKEIEVLKTLSCSPECRSVARLLGYHDLSFPLFYILESTRSDQTLSQWLLYRDQRMRAPLSLFQLLTGPVKDVLCAVQFCQDHAIVLRDITASNFLLDESGASHIRCILFGFDLARVMKSTTTNKSMDNLDTLANDSSGLVYYGSKGTQVPKLWTAPESFLQNVYTMKSDVYMTGHTLIEVMTHGRFPYNELTTLKADDKIFQVLRYGLKPTHPPCIPQIIFVPLLKCFLTTPENRPKIDDLQEMFSDFLSRRKQDDLNQISSRESQESVYYDFATEYRCTPNEFASIDTPIIVKTPQGKVWTSSLIKEFNGAEETALRSLQHENIVQFLGFVYSENERHMEMEFTSERSLLDYCHKTKPSTEKTILHIQQVARGMRYLHENRLVHCALQASTIYMTNVFRDVKIGNLSRTTLLVENLYDDDITSVSVKVFLGEVRNISRWLPREVNDNAYYSMRSDVYMFAVVIWEVFNARAVSSDISPLALVPYANIPIDKLSGVHRCRRTLQQPAECPEWVYSLIKRCTSDPSCRRPLFPQICQFLESENPEEDLLNIILKQPPNAPVAETPSASDSDAPREEARNDNDIVKYHLDEEDYTIFDYFEVGTIGDQEKRKLNYVDQPFYVKQKAEDTFNLPRPSNKNQADVVKSSTKQSRESPSFLRRLKKKALKMSNAVLKRSGGMPQDSSEHPDEEIDEDYYCDLEDYFVSSGEGIYEKLDETDIPIKPVYQRLLPPLPKFDLKGLESTDIVVHAADPTLPEEEFSHCGVLSETSMETDLKMGRKNIQAAIPVPIRVGLEIVDDTIKPETISAENQDSDSEDSGSYDDVVMLKT